MYFVGNTLDDILQDVFRALLVASRPKIKTTRGLTAEIVGALIRLRKPRARLSQTEKKGLPFGCLGELMWYLAGSNQLDFIKHYLPRYAEDAESNGTLHGAYGPRILSQLKTVSALLKRKPSTRRAVIQIFDRKDIRGDFKEIPCTTTLQFLLRNRHLHMFTSMRSNDALWGLPNDVFAFTMIQEMVARELGVELGEYTHTVGSLHYYVDRRADLEAYIQEGWQQERLMPAMPTGNPWPAVRTLVAAEATIRRTGLFSNSRLRQLDEYWMDLLRLLQVHWNGKKRRTSAIQALKKKMSSKAYNEYIDGRLRKATLSLQSPATQGELFDSRPQRKKSD